jgi:stage V sporulation protein S
VLRADVLVDQDEGIIKVRPNSPVQQIANSIRIAIFEERKMPIIRAVGAGAVNQACKGIAIARGYVATQGYDLGMNVGFINLMNDEDEEITALSFHLYMR